VKEDSGGQPSPQTETEALSMPLRSPVSEASVAKPGRHVPLREGPMVE